MNARMHIDGCHFFAWVFETVGGDNELTWYERNGDDLYYHSDGDCERCRALMDGAKPREASQTIELPEDAKQAFFTVVAAIGKLDEAPA